MDADLKNSRESLHRAQRELASKSERIDELEKRLKLSEAAQRKFGDGGAEKMRREIETLRKKNGELAKAMVNLKQHAAARSKAEAKKVAKPAAKSAKNGESITIRYDEDSAASYEGRERVLKWIKVRMNKGAKNFRIEGWANDSGYPEVNDVIANNRARYLADYLVLKGIPECALAVDGSVADQAGSKGRYVTVSTASR